VKLLAENKGHSVCIIKFCFSSSAGRDSGIQKRITGLRKRGKAGGGQKINAQVKNAKGNYGMEASVLDPP